LFLGYEGLYDPNNTLLFAAWQLSNLPENLAEAATGRVTLLLLAAQ
jgi:hypothetical protein